jgi:hypothetical protein
LLVRERALLTAECSRRETQPRPIRALLIRALQAGSSS